MEDILGDNIKKEIKSGSIVNPENVVSLELAQKIETFYRNVLQGNPRSLFVKPDNVQDSIEGEKSFFTRILNLIDKVKKENEGKEIIVLFDIDETIARITMDEVEILRPCILDLLKLIKEKKVEIGVLTSTRDLIIRERLVSLKLKNFFNDSYLFSSRDAQIQVGLSGEDENLIKKEIPKDYQELLGEGDYGKIKILKDLMIKPENINKILIPIDDSPYPIVFKYGVALDSYEIFLI